MRRAANPIAIRSFANGAAYYSAVREEFGLLSNDLRAGTRRRELGVPVETASRFCYRSGTISSGFRVGARRPFFVGRGW